MSQACKGVIFDCDGTLLDSITAWQQAETELARLAHVALDKESTDILCTCTIPEVGKFFHERFGLAQSPQAVVAMIDEFMLDYYEHQACARPGAIEFVEGLVRQGIVCSVASSSSQTHLQAGLANAGFMPYLRAVVSVDDVGVSKREPAVYDRARELMETPLAATWGVEDSLYAIHTLRNAGYCTLGIYSSDVVGSYDDLYHAAHAAISSFEEISVYDFLAYAERQVCDKSLQNVFLPNSEG